MNRNKNDAGIVGTVLLAAVGMLIVVGFIALMASYAYLSYKDGKSVAKPQTCKITEKYVVSRDGHIQDREMRTSCGKLSVGKRVKVWDSIEEGKTYELMIKGGRTGLPDVMAAKELSS